MLVMLLTLILMLVLCVSLACIFPASPAFVPFFSLAVATATSSSSPRGNSGFPPLLRIFLSLSLSYHVFKQLSPFLSPHHHPCRPLFFPIPTMPSYLSPTGPFHSVARSHSPFPISIATPFSTHEYYHASSLLSEPSKPPNPFLLRSFSVFAATGNGN